LQKGKDKTDKPAPENNKTTLQRKVINDAVAYIRGLAQLRCRNQEWAEKAVRESASLPAGDALKQNVIDIVASITADLLKQVDLRAVFVQGQKLRLKPAGLTVDRN